MTMKLSNRYSGARVAELRKARGMSLGDLAIGIYRSGATRHIPSRQQVSAWESEGGYAPRSDVIAAIANALEVSIDDLFSSCKINEKKS